MKKITNLPPKWFEDQKRKITPREYEKLLLNTPLPVKVDNDVWDELRLKEIQLVKELRNLPTNSEAFNQKMKEIRWVKNELSGVPKPRRN